MYSDLELLARFTAEILGEEPPEPPTTVAERLWESGDYGAAVSAAIEPEIALEFVETDEELAELLDVIESVHELAQDLDVIESVHELVQDTVDASQDYIEEEAALLDDVLAAIELHDVSLLAEFIPHADDIAEMLWDSGHEQEAIDFFELYGQYLELSNIDDVSRMSEMLEKAEKLWDAGFEEEALAIVEQYDAMVNSILSDSLPGDARFIASFESIDSASEYILASPIPHDYLIVIYEEGWYKVYVVPSN